MAAKKAGKKKGRKAGKMVDAPIWEGRSECTNEEICAYLTELGKWLKWFNDDYTRLRKAVCNVERKAWGESGSTTARRFCTGGGTDEPPKPVKPPIWI